MIAIITAAGKNSRMINDFKKQDKKPIHKLKLEINNKPILIHTIERTLKSNVDEIIIALGYYKNEIYDLIKEYELLEYVKIAVNENINVGLSKTLDNCIKNNLKEDYVYLAGDQPTITQETINNLIDTLNNSPHPKNTISILARKESGKLKSAKGLGMPFSCNGQLLYDYIKNENQNLNPILRKMIASGVEFYGIEPKNSLELENINYYKEFLYVKSKLEKK